MPQLAHAPLKLWVASFPLITTCFVANRAEVLYDKVMTRALTNGKVTTMIWDGTDYLGEVN